MCRLSLRAFYAEVERKLAEGDRPLARTAAIQRAQVANCSSLHSHSLQCMPSGV